MVRWPFYLLCTLNIAMLVVLWSDHRDSARQQHYAELDDVSRIELVKRVDNGGGREACILLGPFAERALVDTLKADLGMLGYVADVLEQEVSKAPAYQVYVDEFREGYNAAGQVKLFSQVGVDSYVIATGDLAGLISVGVFRNIDSAQRMEKIMRKKGYQTKMAEIERHDDDFWLQVKAAYIVENKKKIADFLRLKSRQSEMRQFFCKSVASQK